MNDRQDGFSANTPYKIIPTYTVTSTREDIRSSKWFQDYHNERVVRDFRNPNARSFNIYRSSIPISMVQDMLRWILSEPTVSDTFYLWHMWIGEDSPFGYERRIAEEYYFAKNLIGLGFRSDAVGDGFVGIVTGVYDDPDDRRFIEHQAPRPIYFDDTGRTQ